MVLAVVVVVVVVVLDRRFRLAGPAFGSSGPGRVATAIPSSLKGYICIPPDETISSISFKAVRF